MYVAIYYVKITTCVDDGINEFWNITKDQQKFNIIIYNDNQIIIL